MKVRFTKNPFEEHSSSNFNVPSLDEVIVMFSGDGGADSCFIGDLDVYIETKQKWMPMYDAFRSHDIIVDNYNTIFFEPKNDADRERGFTL